MVLLLFLPLGRAISRSAERARWPESTFIISTAMPQRMMQMIYFWRLTTYCAKGPFLPRELAPRRTPCRSKLPLDFVHSAGEEGFFKKLSGL